MSNLATVSTFAFFQSLSFVTKFDKEVALDFSQGKITMQTISTAPATSWALADCEVRQQIIFLSAALKKLEKMYKKENSLEIEIGEDFIVVNGVTKISGRLCELHIPMTETLEVYYYGVDNFLEVWNSVKNSFAKEAFQDVYRSIKFEFYVGSNAFKRAVASDGFRLSMHDARSFELDCETHSVIVFGDTLKKLASTLPKKGKIRIDFLKSATKLQIVTEFGIITQDLDGTESLDYMKVIPKNIETTVRCTRAKLIEIIGMFMPDHKVNSRIYIKVEAGKLIVSLDGSSKSMEVEQTGAFKEFSVDQNYILDALNSIHTDLVKIEIPVEHLRPINFKSEGGDSISHQVVVPLRAE
jgi:hypothetical protein